jgi:hypothetical protein
VRHASGHAANGDAVSGDAFRGSDAMADPMRPRLAIVATHPVQYFVPVFRGLASCQEWQTKVFLGCLHGVDGASFDPDFGLNFAWDCDLLGGYSHAVLSAGPLADLSGLRGVAAAPKALQTILAWQPDAVLIFAYSPAFITALSALLALRGVPILLRADTSDEAYSRSRWKSWLRDRLLRLYYRRCTRFYPIGSESYRHYRRLGVAPGRLETVLYAVDTSVIPQDPPAVTTPPPKAAPLRLGFVGKFTAVKDPLAIPRAVALLARQPVMVPCWSRAVGRWRRCSPGVASSMASSTRAGCRASTVRSTC